MRATGWEFRLRFWILLVLYVLGFLAPWDRWVHLDSAGPNAHAWGVLAALLAKTGVVGIVAAFNVLLSLAIVCALAGAWLRTWGAAYLGHEVVHDTRIHGESVIAAGPFRYMRNPLYVGTWLNTAALALLMPPSGAVFTLVTVVAFQVRLVLAEEATLHARLGAAYDEYCSRVPRFAPAIRAAVPATVGVRPEWGRAAMAEVYMWGSAVTFAACGWQYNAGLLVRGVLISLGLSLVVKGMFWDRQSKGLAPAGEAKG